MAGELARAEGHPDWEDGPARWTKELMCAGVSALLVSPLVSIIDKAVVKDVTGFAPMVRAMKEAVRRMVLQPRIFFISPPFVMTAIVYGGTYTAANLSEAALDSAAVEKSSTRKTVKVSIATATNVGLLAWRDSKFAKMYTTGAARAAVPWRTVTGFAVRDTATMAATFYGAPAVADHLQRMYGVNRNAAELGCALAVPVAAQVVTAPLHIYSFDYYARPEGANRFEVIKREFSKVCFARCFRILPAFGFGSYTNTQLRRRFIRHRGHTPLPQVACVR